MKFTFILTLAYFLCSTKTFCQTRKDSVWFMGVETSTNVDQLLELESSAYRIVVLPGESELKQMDSILIDADYLDTLNQKTDIIQFNIAALDESGEVLFIDNPMGNKIPNSFKKKYSACAKCKAIRIEKVRIIWVLNGSYILKKSKQWKVSN